MNLKNYQKQFNQEDAAPGWDAIDQALQKIYPDQEPRHYAATPHYSVGGNDPLDGISVYQVDNQGDPYFHLVTYGFSELYYDEEACGGEYSKFGFELTLRVKPFPEDEEQPLWAINMLQNIARYVFNSGKWFEPNHYMSANGQLKLESGTALTALAFALDPELGVINTPHGEVQFLQVYGLTSEEFEAIKAKGGTAEYMINQHAVGNPMLITDLARKTILD